MKPLNIVIKDSDYRWGDGQLQKGLTGLTINNWISHLDFFVPQLIRDGDTEDCWDFGATKHHDAFMDALISNGLIPQSVLDWFTSVGFFDTGIDGKLHFHSSERWAGVLSGDARNGGWPAQGYDIFRTQGVVPFTKLPVTAEMTLAEYFDPTAITQELKDIGLKFLELMGGKNYCQYQWVVDGGQTNIPRMAQAIVNSPLDLGIPVNSGWNQVHPSIATGQPVHVVTGYAVEGTSVLISDNYSPYLKVLDNGYQISYVMQMILQYIPPPPAPQAPTQPTVQNTVSWLTMLSNWLSLILERLTPSGRARLGGASRSDKWPAFRAEYAKTHPPICAVCGGKSKLNLHHLRPFHAFPELELIESNVVWLCNKNLCHIRIGHLSDFQSINPTGKEDIKLWHDKIASRPMTVEDIKKDMPPLSTDNEQSK